MTAKPSRKQRAPGPPETPDSREAERDLTPPLREESVSDAEREPPRRAAAEAPDRDDPDAETAPHALSEEELAEEEMHEDVAPRTLGRIVGPSSVQSQRLHGSPRKTSNTSK